MQAKRKKRSRIRAAKVTAGHGHKKKNRGAGNRGGRGMAGTGKRGTAKLMKLTGGKKYLGIGGFTSIKTKVISTNLFDLQKNLNSFVENGLVSKSNDTYTINLETLKYEKLLSKGPVTNKLNITVKFATPNAISKVEKAGGKVELIKAEK
jgi:large subunit ribosomal protein L15